MSGRKTKTSGDSQGLYSASVFVKGGTVDQVFDVVEALRDVLFSAGCRPVEGTASWKMDSAIPGFTGFSPPEKSADADEPNVCLAETEIFVGEGAYRLNVARTLNAMGAWLTGLGSDAPAEVARQALRRLFDVMKGIPAVTLCMGPYLFSKHVGDPWIWVLPLKDRDIPMIPHKSEKLSDSAEIAGMISVTLPVHPERMEALYARAVPVPAEKVRTQPEEEKVVFLQDRRDQAPVHREPQAGTAEIIPFRPRPLAN
ncbi:MAG: hypothetical protein M3O22_06440 [Pseudomonadota bacterium]|nr:hypothetical protein [Pseudomonadota bacterium]